MQALFNLIFCKRFIVDDSYTVQNLFTVYHVYEHCFTVIWIKIFCAVVNHLLVYFLFLTSRLPVFILHYYYVYVSYCSAGLPVCGIFFYCAIYLVNAIDNEECINVSVHDSCLLYTSRCV